MSRPHPKVSDSADLGCGTLINFPVDAETAGLDATQALMRSNWGQSELTRMDSKASKMTWQLTDQSAICRNTMVEGKYSRGNQ